MRSIPSSRLVILVVGLLAGAVSLAATPTGLYSKIEIRNLAVANGFWEKVFLARDPERAKDYLAPDYVDHNPNLPVGGGLPAFVAFLNQVKTMFPLPPDTVAKSDIVLTLVDGDLVTFVRKREATSPKDKTTRYNAFNFECFRIKGSKIVEHWDGAWSDIRM